MPRYFFDLHDGDASQRDDTGTEMSDIEAVRTVAMKLLPDIARDEVPRDGNRRAFTVLVTDEDGKAIYTATLIFAGLWLLR